MVKVRKDAETISGSFLRELGPTSTYSGMDNTRRYGRRNPSSNLGRCTRMEIPGLTPGRCRATVWGTDNLPFVEVVLGIGEPTWL